MDQLISNCGFVGSILKVIAPLQKLQSSPEYFETLKLKTLYTVSTQYQPIARMEGIATKLPQWFMAAAMASCCSCSGKKSVFSGSLEADSGTGNGARAAKVNHH